MKFAIVILAVVAAATAQFQPNPYNQYNQYNQYNPNQYNPNQYNPYNRLNAGQYNRYNQYSTPSPFRPFVSSTPSPVTYSPSTIAPPVAVLAKNYNNDARNAQIVKYENEINPDGSYTYYYETDNGIAAQEQGVPRNFGGNPPVVPDVASGSFSYTSPEGVPVAISYIADENGFQPQGNVLPTPPAIPAQIARALEYIARSAPKK